MAASCTGGTLEPRKGAGLSEPHRKQTEAPHLLHRNNFEVHRLYKRRTKCVDGELDRVVTTTGGVWGATWPSQSHRKVCRAFNREQSLSQ